MNNCEEYDEERGNGDYSGQWYREEAEHRDAAGVGNLDYGERVRRASAPLQRPQSKLDTALGPSGCVSAARKAVQAAAMAACEHSQNNKAYEKLSVLAFPKSGDNA